MESSSRAGAALLAWYDQNRRDLPWRRSADPYRIWVSEIMLQQTRVETVLPYYAAFVERFPTVDALARAEVEHVLPLWSGLGYYRRCRQLHAAARMISARGRFPATVAELEELPGVGEYTAAAVASIAFGAVTPVLDGNVERVVGRLLALEEDSRSRVSRQRLRAAAAELLSPARPGDSNQALMELGATHCSPRTPRCLLCPLSSDCRAFASGSPERFPPARARKAPVAVRQVAVVVEDGGRWLLFRRPDDSELLAGTWELPWAELGADEEIPAARERLTMKYGGLWTIGPREAAVKHGITFRALSVEIVAGAVDPSGYLAEGPPSRWCSREQRKELAKSSLLGKIERAWDERAVTPSRVRSPRRRA